MADEETRLLPGSAVPMVTTPVTDITGIAGWSISIPEFITGIATEKQRIETVRHVILFMSSFVNFFFLPL
jgi:hypothetical protein